MPEGDTIFRTAVTLERWLGGRTVTAARTTVEGVAVAKLVGQVVERVEARGKHLLVRFAAGQVLHTHMRMDGSWHVYPAGERWRKPAHRARVVLEAGERVAVCFDAPVVELLAKRAELVHPALAGLGPDVLDRPLDLDEIRRRASTRPPDMLVGDLLLDQTVASGIGNIYRCETLFLCRLHPSAPVGELEPAQLDRLFTVAAELLERNARPKEYRGREFGGGPDRPWVYGRSGRPCHRCRTPIAFARTGHQARQVYWCPRCQPAGRGSPDRRPP